MCGEKLFDKAIEQWYIFYKWNRCQELVVRQPIKTGGLGMRSLVEISTAAYLGAMETAIPSFTGKAGSVHS